jgi:hypothetical protein
MAAARRPHGLVLAAALLAATPSLAADAALIAAAKREGEVTWYTTQIINQFGRPAIDLFQKSYGIKVTVLRGDAVELAARLISEAEAGQVAADVFDGTSNAPALKKAGIALQWLPDAAQKLPPAYRDAEGYWVATNLYVHTPAYNTDLVPRGSGPRAGRTCWIPNGAASSPGRAMRQPPRPPVLLVSCWVSSAMRRGAPISKNWHSSASFRWRARRGRSSIRRSPANIRSCCRCSTTSRW